MRVGAQICLDSAPARERKKREIGVSDVPVSIVNLRIAGRNGDKTCQIRKKRG